MDAVHVVLHLLLRLKPLHASVSLALELEFTVHLIDVVSDFFSRGESGETNFAYLHVPLYAALVAKMWTPKLCVI